MRVALVHELLTIRGGAERVLKILADMFPDAPIYTFLYDEKLFGDIFPKERIRTSRLQRYAGLSTNHHLYLLFFPAAAEAWDFSEYDLVISSSSAFAHGIITNSQPKHISLIHSPARYLWDRTHDILERAGKGPLGPLKRWYLSQAFHKLRIWDAESADRADCLIAMSHEVQRRIELYWRRESEVIYPPIGNQWFDTTHYSLPTTHSSYFLLVSTLADYKRIDLAIQACNQLNLPLKIAGTGTAFASLKKIAGPTIEFLGYQNDMQLKELYTNATAVLFPGEEDFGLVPLEANACGTSVIAYRGGGALETVIEFETGMFFDEPTASSLAQALQKFEYKKYSKEKCRMHASKFSQSQFEQKLNSVIERTVSRL